MRGPLWRGGLVILAVLALVDVLVSAGLEPLALADQQARDATLFRRVALYHHAPKSGCVCWVARACRRASARRC